MVRILFVLVLSALGVASKFAPVMAQDGLKKDDPSPKENLAASLKVGDLAPALKVAKWLQGDAVRKLGSGEMTPKEQLAAIQAEHIAADAAFFKAPKAVSGTPEEKKKQADLLQAYNAGQGIKIKLHDYRGKVTVVVFWASWCGPCMEMVPRERKLVARLKGRDFVLIGVNGDEDRDKAKQVAAKNEMTWRSFWNGPKKGDGTLTSAWNVQYWPTIYVLDDSGVIRYKDPQVSGGGLDKAVDELLAELEKRKRDQGSAQQ